MLAGEEIIHLIFEHHVDDGKTEKGCAPDIRLFLYRVHGDLDRDCDKLLDLLGAPARPLGDNRHLRIRHIRKRVDRRMDKAGDTGDYGDRGTEEDKEFQKGVLAGDINNTIEEFWDSVQTKLNVMGMIGIEAERIYKDLEKHIKKMNNRGYIFKIK